MCIRDSWYIVQAGAIDPGARKPLFDDELMGELVRFVDVYKRQALQIVCTGIKVNW